MAQIIKEFIRKPKAGPGAELLTDINIINGTDEMGDSEDSLIGWVLECAHGDMFVTEKYIYECTRSEVKEA